MAASGQLAAAAAALLVLTLMSSATPAVRSDFSSDRAECESQLLGLATCITYVQNSALAPTPDCCSGVKGVVEKSLKCLCVLIKDRDEPGLGFKINVSRAILLPSKCQTPANIADCPRLLNLPANSSQAKEFEQFAKAIASTGASGSGSSSSAGSSSSGGRRAGGQSSSKINSPTTSGGESKQRWSSAASVSALFVILLRVIFT